MDNSIFSSLSGTHKMLTRYKKHLIRTNKYNRIISDTSDEDYDPSKDKCSSANSSTSSLNILDEVDENELKLLISDAKRIITTIAEKYISDDEEDDDGAGGGAAGGSVLVLLRVRGAGHEAERGLRAAPPLP